METMDQAVLITAYKELSWLKYICEIWSKYFKVYVHYDKKSKDSNESLVLNEIRNVKVVSKHRVNWGSYKHIEAILDLMQLAKNDGCKYFHILSGDTIPIVHPLCIRDFFHEHSDNIFMRFFYRKETKNYRYGAWFFEHVFNKRGGGIGRIYRFIENKVILNLAKIPIRKGISFPCYSYVYSHFNSEVADYILKYSDEHPEFMRELKYCFVPEELFFCNIIEQSPYRDSVIDNHYIYHIWTEERGYPANLNLNDFDDIVMSDRLFARKVSEKDRDLLFAIQQKYLF